MLLSKTKQIIDYNGCFSIFKYSSQFIVFETPTLSSVEAQSQSSVIVYWNEPDFGGMAANITNYMVLWIPNDEERSVIVQPNSNDALISNLTSNTNYSFQIKIQGSNGQDSAPSIELFEATRKIIL